MNKQLVCLLIALIGFQLANSLRCHTCTTPSNCKYPQQISCSNAAASDTRVALQPILGNLPEMAGNSFECINVTWYRSSMVRPDEMVVGCALKNSNTCSQENPKYLFYTCAACTKDLCPKDSAGNFSNSLITIVTSFMALVLAKTFATA